jgi:hypothetical protein
MISRQSAFRFNYHLVDVIAVETFERAYVVSQPGRIEMDENHRCLTHPGGGALVVLVVTPANAGAYAQSSGFSARHSLPISFVAVSHRLSYMGIGSTE